MRCSGFLLAAATFTANGATSGLAGVSQVPIVRVSGDGGTPPTDISPTNFGLVEGPGALVAVIAVHLGTIQDLPETFSDNELQNPLLSPARRAHGPGPRD